MREDKIDQIGDLRDESDQRGMSIVIELKRGAQPKKVLNQLYKYTALQSTFGVQMLALVDGEPRTLPLKKALQIFIEHRQTVIVRRSKFELAKARARQHILDGYLIALNNLDAVIRTIRESQDADEAKTNLMTVSSSVSFNRRPSWICSCAVWRPLNARRSKTSTSKWRT